MEETNGEIQDKRERAKIKHSPNNAEARIPERKQETQSIVQEGSLAVDEEREFFKQKDSSLYETVETEVIDKLSPLESKKEEAHTKLSKLDEETKNILNSIRERDEAKKNFLDSYVEKLVKLVRNRHSSNACLIFLLEKKSNQGTPYSKQP